MKSRKKMKDGDKPMEIQKGKKKKTRLEKKENNIKKKEENIDRKVNVGCNTKL